MILFFAGLALGLILGLGLGFVAFLEVRRRCERAIEENDANWMEIA